MAQANYVQQQISHVEISPVVARSRDESGKVKGFTCPYLARRFRAGGGLNAVAVRRKSGDVDKGYLRHQGIAVPSGPHQRMAANTWGNDPNGNDQLSIFGGASPGPGSTL